MTTRRHGHLPHGPIKGDQAIPGVDDYAAQLAELHPGFTLEDLEAYWRTAGLGPSADDADEPTLF